LLISYIVVAVAITQLPVNLPLSYRGFKDISFSFTPFYCIRNVVRIINSIIAECLPLKSYLFSVLKDHLQNLILNILLFIPFGFLLTVNLRKSNVLEVMLGSFLFSLSLEILQVIEMMFSLTLVRVFDIDDIIANTIGGIFGFVFAVLFSKIKERRPNQAV